MKYREQYDQPTLDEVGYIPLNARAKVLIEALPWIKDTTGKTVVIKYGGAAMVDENLRDAVVADILLLKLMGVNPIIVHGGGPKINAVAERLGVPVQYENGQRVTNDEMMQVVKMTLVGQVNQELVSAINKHGGIAVGLNGADAKILQGEAFDENSQRTGRVKRVNTTLIEDLIEHDYIPVIATVGWAPDGAYNINADTVAGEVAAAVGAQKIVFITDVDGLYDDFSNKDTLFGLLTLSEAQALVTDGKLSTGMIPKIGAIVTALSAGVEKAHIVNGTKPHALVLEIFTDEGLGTMIVRDKRVDPDFPAPLDNFAVKLEGKIGLPGVED